MLVLIVLGGASAAGALVLALGTVLDRQRASVERQLAGYEPPDVADQPVSKASVTRAAPETAVVQQAVELTARLAQRAGVLARLERALEQADLPLRAGELLFYIPTFAILVFLLLAIVGGPIVGVAGAAAVTLVPILYVSRRQQLRVRKFERQLPDTLTLLASSLRAGFSLMQGLETVSQEIGEPMRRELQRVFTEVRLGRAAEDALDDAAVRMANRDLAWTVMAVRIQREVGGNLASLLDTVADTMLKRERLRREIRALTAEGRLTAIILSLLPPIAGVGLWLANATYINTLFNHAVGIVAIILAIGLSIVGWFWLRRIIDIEV